MQIAFRNVATAAFVMSLVCNTTSAVPLLPASLGPHSSAHIVPAQLYPVPEILYPSMSPPPPPRGSVRRARPRYYDYEYLSPGRATVCLQIRNDYPERNFRCP
jgi:hypothetical protein